MPGKAITRPIVSEQQRKFFGAELRRLMMGKKSKTGMSETEIEAHLEESKGKKLPRRAKRGY